ncbi:MAG: transketolase family protein, partial [Coriobacteriia bacterium]|nr:transketolase family protein [Coriobacteriia bacterium]
MSDRTLASIDPTLDKKATRAAYGETLLALAEEGVDVYAVDADLAGSTTTVRLAEFDQARHINVGIAEQNMIGVAAGISLADSDKVVFTGSFAVFGTGRVYDQIRNSVCYANLNVKIAPTHAGISTGADGGSHQMIEDIALMRVLPNMRILVPADYHSAEAAIRIAATTPGPFYVRLGRLDIPQIYPDALGFSTGQAQ